MSTNQTNPIKYYKFLLLLITFQIWSQTTNETYLFAQDIESKIEKDTLPWRYQSGATEYSISQYYKKALQTWDKNGSRVRKIAIEDSLHFNNFEKEDAKNYIIARSPKEQIIIINEAHHNSRHRVFTASLLQGLYDNGYRFLGLEALSDTLVNKRKFAVKESGYYTQEPQMANLINLAIRIGFTVFGYETTDGSNGKEREKQQAANIAKIIRQNPGSKFLIHCGYDHAIEGTPGDKSWEKAMAGRLKEITHIDPFTIDQVAYSEKGSVEFNHPYIQMAHAKQPVILVNQNGKTFNGSATNDQTDCRIIHPITQYIEGRPDWLRMNGIKKSYPIPRHEITDYPALVLAYRKKEYEQEGIPADLIEIVTPEDPAFLLLEKGNYKIIIKNKQYRMINELDIRVK